ncbi:MAG: putative lipid II flippase FtsW [Chloroflexi bacterium]|nr:putative lipid II flippase FtsW [Chloroflexota bacterium]
MASSRGVESHSPDYMLLAIVGALVTVGLQGVYSASFGLGLQEYGDANYFLVRQGMWTAIGLVLLFVLMRIDYHRWKALSPWMMLATLGALLVVLVPGLGVTTYGATRWLNLPFLSVQPSEVAKLTLIIYVSAWLAGRGERLKAVAGGILPFVLILSLVGGLVMLQPDTGTTVVMVLTTATLFFLAGANLLHLTALGLAGAGAGSLLISLAPYRLIRMESFLHPELDPQGKGFHIIQLLIAMGSGGIMGRGIGESRQKFFYVPGSHTDGIFAILGEEVGFIGSMLVLALFVALAYRSFKVVLEAPDDFGALLAAGVVCWIGYQTLINIGGITRSLPLTGIPLPFLSYGGSALAASLGAVGILLSVSRYTAKGLRGSFDRSR